MNAMNYFHFMHIGIKEIAIFEHLQLYMDRDCNYNIKQEKGTCLTGTEVYRTRMKEIDQMNVSYMPALFTAFLCWGTQYVMSKIALQTLPPVTLLLVRYAVAVPTLFLLLIFRRKLKPLQRKDVKMVAAIGFTGYFFSFCVQMMGINRLSGSVSSLLGAMHPVLIPILAALFLKEKLTMARIACVFVSMTGVVIIVGVDGTADPVGVVLMLFATLLWSGASIIIRRIAPHYDPMQVAMMAILFATPLTAVGSAIELQTHSASFPMKTLLAALFMGTIGTAAPHSLWNYCLSKMDASFCSMFYPLQPLVSATLGVLFLGEQITTAYVVGAVVICCGIVGAVISGKKRA